MKTDNITVVNSGQFSFARGFVMPDSKQKQEKKGDWVKWGKHNLYPQFLNKIFYESAYQSGIIRGKCHYITGSGVNITGGNRVRLEQVLGDFTIEDIIEDVCMDFELYDGFALKIIPNKAGTAINSIEHINFDHLRFNPSKTKVFYSDDWSEPKQSRERSGLKEYAVFNPDNLEEESIFFYIKTPKRTEIRRRGNFENVYPTPPYSGCLKGLMTDVEIQSFHLHNIINSMKVSGALNFANGKPENKREFESEVQDAITPTENSGGILITYSNGDENKPSFIPFTGEDLSKRYNMLEKSVVQNIMVGHQATTPALFGIKTKGQLGQQTELETAFTIFKKTYVRGRQKVLQDQLNFVFNGIAEIELIEPENLFPQKQETSQDFADKEESAIIGELALCGKPKDNYRILNSNQVTDDIDFEASEKKMKSAFLDGKFQITETDAKVLDLVRNGETLDGIVAAVGDEAREAYGNMVKKGYIEDGEITAEGIRQLATNQPEVELQVLYSYEKRPDVDGEAIIPTTRDFCRSLIQLNRMYTRAEIEEISARVDRNVWRYRGGWYNNPDRNRPTPFCRHIWKQNLTVSR